MDKKERCKLLLKLWFDEERLINISMKELTKVLYINHANEELVKLTITKRKRAKSRIYTEKSRRKAEKKIKELKYEKKKLEEEEQRLITEINFMNSF